MEMRRNLQGRSRATGILSAILLCLAAFLAVAHGTLASSDVFSSIAAPGPATGGMGITDQPPAPIIHKRSFVVVSAKPDKLTVLKDTGGGHVALPPGENRLPDFGFRQPIASAASPAPTCGIDRGYDACAPPALI